MIRLNILLTFVLIICALSIVASQHRVRKLRVELEEAQAVSRQLAVEWGQLQIEQGTWAMHARVEKIATAQLRMYVPDTKHIRIIVPAAGSGLSGGPATAPSSGSP